MNEVRLPMGKEFNSYLGRIKLPSDILEIGIFEDFTSFDCVDGVYTVQRSDKSLTIKKIFTKKLSKIVKSKECLNKLPESL